MERRSVWTSPSTLRTQGCPKTCSSAGSVPPAKFSELLAICQQYLQVLTSQLPSAGIWAIGASRRSRAKIGYGLFSSCSMVISSSQLVGITIAFLLISSRRGPRRDRRHPRPGTQRGSGRTTLTTQPKISLIVGRGSQPQSGHAERGSYRPTATFLRQHGLHDPARLDRRDVGVNGDIGLASAISLMGLDGFEQGLVL